MLLYVLCGSLALYPLVTSFLAPVIATAYFFAALGVVARMLRNGFGVPRTYLGWVWASYAFVYGIWYAVALVHGNNVTYINQDALGFLLYFGVLPILFLYIKFRRLESAFVQFVVDCCTLIATMSVVVVAGYYVVFGDINADSMLLINAYLASIGLTWQIDHNAGVFGVYTNAGHLLLIGIAVVLYIYSVAGRKGDLALFTLYLVGIVLDGHRALVIAAVMQLLILVPRLLGRTSASKKIVLMTALVLVPTIAALVGLDWIEARFAFTTDDPSTAERYAQIPALLDKIMENPLIGSGFGSVASYIRSIERPFSYEVDFLATAMKLGVLGSLIYFGTYLAALAYGYRSSGQAGLFLLSAGLSFFFYMGTNGNQAMSSDSSVFHIFIFLLIAFAANSAKRHRVSIGALPTAQ